MFLRSAQKLQGCYKWYVLWLVSIGYIFAELGHYLIGTTTKAIARDLHYGDKACLLNSTNLTLRQLPLICEKVNSTELCESLTLNGTRYCEWGYNGLGLDYQVLAGPAFMAVFTVVGVLLGVVADRHNRARVLSICTVVFVCAILLMGSVTEYWHLVVLRMVLAAGESGCNPLATGILTDLFPERQRALVLSVFNWGIYGGYGIAFPVGRYIPVLDAWGLSWRMCYYAAGVVGVAIALLTVLTLRDPQITAVGEEGAGTKNGTSMESGPTSASIWRVITQPRILMLCLATTIRYCGGMCFAYNADLYYRDYFPDVDLGWWLFAVTVGIGSIGVVAGGVISDRLVSTLGVRSRVAVLATSQALATVPALGSILLQPELAMTCLAISYFFAEMWFGLVLAILVELVPAGARSTAVAIFLFVTYNAGGNLPVLVHPLAKAIGYREALTGFYAGLYGLSSILFFLTMFLDNGTKKNLSGSSKVDTTLQPETVVSKVLLEPSYISRL